VKHGLISKLLAGTLAAGALAASGVAVAGPALADPPTGISGNVIDTSGRPLGNVEVWAYTTDGSRQVHTLTSADGSYALTNVPAGSEKVCFFSTYATGGSSTTGYRNQCWKGVAPSSIADGLPIAVPYGQVVTGIDPVIVPSGAIRGTVTDAATGAALQRVSVGVYNNWGTLLTTTSTDSSGKYFVPNLDLGVAKVCFDPSQALGGTPDFQYNDQCWNSIDFTSPVDATPINIALGQLSDGIDARLDGDLAISCELNCTAPPAVGPGSGAGGSGGSGSGGGGGGGGSGDGGDGGAPCFVSCLLPNPDPKPCLLGSDDEGACGGTEPATWGPGPNWNPQKWVDRFGPVARAVGEGSGPLGPTDTAMKKLLASNGTIGEDPGGIADFARLVKDFTDSLASPNETHYQALQKLNALLSRFSKVWPTGRKPFLPTANVNKVLELVSAKRLFEVGMDSFRPEPSDNQQANGGLSPDYIFDDGGLGDHVRSPNGKDVQTARNSIRDSVNQKIRTYSRLGRFINVVDDASDMPALQNLSQDEFNAVVKDATQGIPRPANGLQVTVIGPRGMVTSQLW
jgi:hypothetical protein